MILGPALGGISFYTFPGSAVIPITNTTGVPILGLGLGWGGWYAVGNSVPLLPPQPTIFYTVLTSVDTDGYTVKLTAV